MGPSQPIPPNISNKTNVDTDKEKIVEVFTKCIHNILSKIKSLEDLQQIDDKFLKGEFSSFLDNLENHV